MEAMQVAAPKRRFAGAPAGGSRAANLAALADVLLSPAASPRPAPAARPVRCEVPDAPVETMAAPRGVYAILPAGIDSPDRRRTAMAVAAHLAPRTGTAAVVIVEGGRAEAHLVGEPACGRLGPQQFVNAAAEDTAVAALLGQCDQVALVLVDGPGGSPRRVRSMARRAVFVTGADAEGLVETYRGLKAWRVAAGDGASEAAVFVVGGGGPEEAGRFHRRLRAASQRFLGRDVAAQGYLAHVAAPSGGSPEPLCVLAQAPAERVWSWLTAATAPCAAAEPASGLAAASCATAGLARPCPSDTLQTTARTGRATPLPATSDPAPAVAGGPCPVFSIWEPAGRECLVAAIEVQAPALLAGSLREVFRVEVDEAGAPPLAGVRADGALVAILLQDGDRPVDTGAATAWLNLHRSLFIRAYPRAGIQAGAAPAAIVLAPLSATPRTDGVLRFLPVRFGGHRGIVLVP